MKRWSTTRDQEANTLTNGFPVGSLAFSPDGHTLIVGGSKHHFLVGDRGGLQLWDVSSWQPTGSLPGDASDIVQVALSDRGTLLATAHTNGPVSLWNAHTRRLLHRFVRVTSLAFSPDGQTLASAGEGGGLKLWHVATHQVALTLKGHRSAVKGIAFSRDGNFMASCALDGTVRLWPAATREEADRAKPSDQQAQ